MQAEDVEQCESAAEFLLEPWVLLQLPFEPTILHQWTVALMAEALRFQKKITDFTTMAYPEHLKTVVDKLIAIASLLLNGANKFLSFIAKLVNVKKDSINRMHATASLYWNDFQEILPQVVVALKFVLSEECGAVISALKRMAWNENADERTGSSEMDVNIMPDGIYSLYYWDDPDNAPRSLFSDQKDLEIKDDDDQGFPIPHFGSKMAAGIT